MTYENWCKHSKEILTEAEKYNAWRRRAKYFLLTKTAPRLARLSESGYWGCGFHYEKEKTLGWLLIAMAIPWQPSANHCDKVEAARDSNMTTEIIYDLFLGEVRKAARSVSAYQRVFNRK